MGQGLKRGVRLSLMGALAYLLLGAAQAEVVVPIHAVNAHGIGKLLGNVVLEDSDSGLVLTPHLKDLMPGMHGFHIHENGACGPEGEGGKKGPALAAGGHFDPEQNGKHDLPWGYGHIGDLPALYVAADGSATEPVLASRLNVEFVKGHSLIIHEGGDNHSDTPKPAGGGGARVVCGVIPG